MAIPAYYKNGVPYGADGHVIITITGGAVGPHLAVGSDAERPVYVGWPGLSAPMSHGIGPIAKYEPKELAHHSLESIREGQTQINELIIKARNAYRQNIEKLVRDSAHLLDSLKKSGLINHPELQLSVIALEEAVLALQVNVAQKNRAEQAVSIKTQAAEIAFEQFIKREDVKMHNFRDARPFAFDFVLSISPVYRHIVELWNTLYLPNLQQEMEEKNNLVTYLDRIKIICDDIVSKTKNLDNERKRIERKEQIIKELEKHKNKPTPVTNPITPVTDIAIKPLTAEPVVIDPVIFDPIIIEPESPTDLTLNTDLALQKATAPIPFTPLHPRPISQLKPINSASNENIENGALKDAIKLTADFYNELTEKWGEQSAKIAKKLAWDAKGKQIRNVDEALKEFEKHKRALNKKFSVKDREAIGKALESLNREEMAKNFARFSKAFYYTVKGIDAYDLYIEFKKGCDTDNWRPFFVKIETIGAGMAASALTAFAYSILLGTPMGILGFALIMTLVGVFIDDKFVEKINKSLSI